jgi:hypothetical protein
MRIAKQLKPAKSPSTPPATPRILMQYYSDYNKKLKIELFYEHPLEMLQMQGFYVCLGLSPNIMQEIW